MNKYFIPVSASFMIILGVLVTNYQNNQATAYPLNNTTTNYRFGTISSLQNDQNGVPAWILSGHWKSNLASNLSAAMGQKTAPFNAQFEMVLLNGTAAHTHTITNFVASNSSQPNNSTIIFNGTTINGSIHYIKKLIYWLIILPIHICILRGMIGVHDSL